MDINPLSLLEVTMGSDPVENNEDDDDDCIIVDTPIETHVIDDTPDPVNPDPEPEMVAGAGYHFLQQTEDPLSLADSHATTNSNMSYFWVNTNINNLTNVTPAEREFRHMHYKDIHNVLQDRLHCTICQDHIGCDIRLHSKAIEHPVLKVLVCERCTTNYKSLQFPLNGHGKETRCRWCGKSPMGGGTPLRRCQQCPFSFCQTCLANNLPNNQPKPGTLWTCCVCNMKLLWPARSLLWALQTLKDRFLSRPSTSNFGAEGDISMCCKGICKKKSYTKIAPKPKSVRDSMPTKVIINGTPLVRPKVYHLASVANQNLASGGHMKLVRIPQVIQPPIQPPMLRLQNITSTRPRRPPTPMPREPMPQDAPAEIEHLPPPDCEADEVSTVWLKTKIDSFTRDLSKLSSTLTTMCNEIPPTDTIRNIHLKMDSIATLLALNSSLLKDSGINLVNEWKERKARHVIEKLHPASASFSPRLEEPIQEERICLPVTPASRKHYESPTTSSKNVLVKVKPEPSKNPKNRKKPKRLTPVKKSRSKKLSNRNAGGLSEDMLEELLKEYDIKDCFVPLKKLRLPFSFQNRRYSFIKVERS